MWIGLENERLAVGLFGQGHFGEQLDKSISIVSVVVDAGMKEL